MTESESPDSTAELIDSAADGAPDHLRAAYDRDMRHLHSLTPALRQTRLPAQRTLCYRNADTGIVNATVFTTPLR